METRFFSMGLQLGTWISPGNLGRKPNGSLQFFENHGEQRMYGIPASCHLLAKRCRSRRPEILKVSCSFEKSPASVLEVGCFPAFFDESTVIKNKSEEIEPYLNGRCIYLVGMMGSGKTTVGKDLAEALGYSFYDWLPPNHYFCLLQMQNVVLVNVFSDTLIEEAVGGSTVAEIFQSYGENFFRDNETEALLKLSAMHRLVVSTGGGAVVRPVNWRHMRKGISVWLDVPLEALARRITSVGTHSRPLLHHESGDPFSKLELDVITLAKFSSSKLEQIPTRARTMKRLSALFEERGDSYANADVRVSLENIAAKLGSEDVCNLTPTAIAIEALLQMENFLKK
ncbi:Shikimate kinase, chloroplastic [Orobanche hederae]